jgi:membrane protease YdiL (CAAX protease family)
MVLLGPAVFSVAALYAHIIGSWAATAPPVLRGEPPLMILPLFLVVLFLTDGVGEELAWRGFALPRLLASYYALVASLILGALWAAWRSC